MVIDWNVSAGVRKERSTMVHVTWSNILCRFILFTFTRKVYVGLRSRARARTEARKEREMPQVPSALDDNETTNEEIGVDMSH